MKIIPIDVNADVINIVALGDIQYGNEGFSDKALRLFLQDVTEDSVNAPLSIIGTGDYIDAMSPSNRERYRASGLYSSLRRRIQSHTLRTLVHELFDRYLTPFAGQFAVLCRGHHWFNYEWEPDVDPNSIAEEQRLPGETPALTSDSHLARLLDTQLASHHVLVSYRFPSGRTYNVLAWHGAGNGVTLTYGLNKLVRASSGWEQIDAIFMGHTHKLGAVAETRLRVSEDGKDVIARSIPLVNSGSYLRGYLINDCAYPEDKGLNALALGGAMLRVRDVGTGYRNRISIYV